MFERYEQIIRHCHEKGYCFGFNRLKSGDLDVVDFTISLSDDRKLGFTLDLNEECEETVWAELNYCRGLGQPDEEEKEELAAAFRADQGPFDDMEIEPDSQVRLYGVFGDSGFDLTQLEEWLDYLRGNPPVIAYLRDGFTTALPEVKNLIEDGTMLAKAVASFARSEINDLDSMVDKLGCSRVEARFITYILLYLGFISGNGEDGYRKADYPTPIIIALERDDLGAIVTYIQEELHHER